MSSISILFISKLIISCQIKVNIEFMNSKYTFDPLSMVTFVIVVSSIMYNLWTD